MRPDEEGEMRRFLISGTLVGGLLLFVLNWFSAAVLPPRYKQFVNSEAAVDAIRSNTTGNGIYAARQGLFVAVALRTESSRGGANFGARIIGQFLMEYLVAFGLTLLLLATPIRSPLSAGEFLGLAGLIAGIETHFPNWNWSGFPTSYLLAGSGYLAVNWFVVGLTLGLVRRKAEPAPQP
jgi:hypothetical protein